jgi:hypothetical protein
LHEKKQNRNGNMTATNQVNSMRVDMASKVVFIGRVDGSHLLGIDTYIFIICR